MAGSIYDRSTYLPIKYITTDAGRVKALDLYSARYSEALRGISNFTSFQVTDDVEHRLDIISNKAYGTPDLWWVIGVYNGVLNPMWELLTGSYLRIPARADVEFILQNKANDTSITDFPTASFSGAVTVELR